MKMPMVSMYSPFTMARTSDMVAATSSIWIIGSLYFSRYSCHIEVLRGGVRVLSPYFWRLSVTSLSLSPSRGIAILLFSMLINGK